MSIPTLRDLMDLLPADIDLAATLTEASRVLTVESVGALLVKHDDTACGILSERDIVRAIADGGDPTEERVEGWMTEDLLTIDRDGAVFDALEMMEANEVRHIVVTAKGTPVGLVSQRRLIANDVIVSL